MLDDYLKKYNTDTVSYYIHIPFCHKKCGYCDFYATVNFDSNIVQDYVDAICNEYNIISDKYHDKIANFHKPFTIFFGGGTPSILSASHIQQIIRTIDPNKTAGEITLEANPDDLTYDYLKAGAAAGINRLSIGVQSFDQNVLNTLGRTHHVENVVGGVSYAKELGLNFSLDLIYGAPNETAKSWVNTVRQAIDLAPNHISMYALTLSKSVPLFHKIKHNEFPDLDSDMQAEKYQLADSLLLSSGYNWYEMSNYARNVQDSEQGSTQNNMQNHSLHNLQYWLGGNYFGLGASAHSFVHCGDNYKRYSNHPNLRLYTANLGECYEYEGLDTKSRKFEQIMLKSRLNIDLGEHLNLNEGLLTKLQKDGLLDSENYPTLKGRLLGDELIRQISEYSKCERYQTSRCMSCPQCIME